VQLQPRLRLRTDHKQLFSWICPEMHLFSIRQFVPVRKGMELSQPSSRGSQPTRAAELSLGDRACLALKMGNRALTTEKLCLECTVRAQVLKTR
jgi:PIN domain nuclease of toxin-antitoxin system